MMGGGVCALAAMAKRAGGWAGGWGDGTHWGVARGSQRAGHGACIQAAQGGRFGGCRHRVGRWQAYGCSGSWRHGLPEKTNKQGGNERKGSA